MKHKATMFFVLLISFYLNADSLLIHRFDSLRRYEHEVSKAKFLTVSGEILFGGSYGLALIVSPILASSPHKMDQDVSKVLWIPIAGPIAADIVDGIDEPAFTLVCIGWSVTELVGAVLLTSGIIRRKNLNKKRRSLSFCPGLIQGRYPGIELSISL